MTIRRTDSGRLAENGCFYAWLPALKVLHCSNNLYSMPTKTWPLLLLLASISACRIFQPAVHSRSSSAQTYTGILRTSFSVNPNGAAELSIPIDIPPGIAGRQPDLSVMYNSQSGNGLLGIGFALSGLSTISRTGATLPQDGFRSGVNYDYNDRLSVDGNRLMNTTPSASNYFSSSAIYMTELQSWTRIVPHGASGIGPASFTAFFKDGSVAQYGDTWSSSVFARGPLFSQGPKTASLRSWLMSSITDADSNRINYTYTYTPSDLQGNPLVGSSDSSMAYPDVIWYTANRKTKASRTVRFLYEPRPDTMTAYAGGARVSTYLRLKAIDTYILTGSDSGRVSRYVFQYDPQSPQHISRLLSVCQQGRKGDSTRALRFTWTNGADGMVASAGAWNAPPPGNAGFEGDFNGDGKTDLLPLENGALNAIYFSSGAGFTKQPLSKGIVAAANTFVADFNADGLPDLLTANNISGKLYYGNGKGFNDNYVTVPLALNPTCTACNLAADFNGDGKADLLTVSGSGGYLYLADSTGLKRDLTLSNLRLDPQHLFVADFNGDGQADLFSPGTLGGTLYLSDISHSNSFLPAIQTIGMNLSPEKADNMIADFNGDGIADLLTHTNQEYLLYFGNGQGFDSSRRLSNINLNLTQNWLSDFNGDGAIDFYALTRDSAWVYYFAGNGFQARRIAASTLLPTSSWSGDFNGDGIADLFAANSGNMYFGANTAGLQTANQVPHLLVAIDNGINGTTSIVYKPMTDSSVYSGGGVCPGGVTGRRLQNKYNSVPLAPTQITPYPLVQTQTCTYLVSSYVNRDGLGDAYSYGYTYSGSLADLLGYGWLGFGQVVETDSNAGNKYVMQYQQLFPLTGRISNVTKTDLNDAVWRRTRNDYQLDAFSNPSMGSTVYQVNLARTRKDYFDSGSFAYTTGIDYKYDGFGNMTLKAVLNDTAESHPIYYLQRFYDDTASAWHIGFTKSTLKSSDSIGVTVLEDRHYTIDTNTLQLLADSRWLNTNNSWLTHSYGYDEFGNRISQADVAGDTTYIQIDSVDHCYPVRMISPPNQWGQRLTTTSTFDPAYGNLVTAVDANNNAFSVITDQFGRDSLRIGPDSSGKPVVLSRMMYYPNATAGYTVQHITRNNWAGTIWDTTEMVYDGLGRLYQNVWRGQAHERIQSTKTFNSCDQVLTEGLPAFAGVQPLVQLYQYDPCQRLTAVQYPSANGGYITNQFLYRGKQTLIKEGVRTPDSVTSAEFIDYFDNAQKVVQRTDQAGQTTRFSYDLMGRLLSATDPGNQITKWVYNSVDDIIGNFNPSAGTRNTLYDYPRRIIRTVNNTGDTLTSTFDALNRRVSLLAGTAEYRFQFDNPGHQNGIGNLCRAILPDTTLSYTWQYDPNTQPTETVFHRGNESYAEAFTYNPDKSVAGVLYADSSFANYYYYDNGALREVQFADTGAQGARSMVSYRQYDAFGDELNLLYGNGVVRQAKFDPYGSLAGYKIINANGTPLLNRAYSWNNVYQLSSITDSADNESSQTFHYTPNGRLDTALGTYGRINFRYDPSGNLVGMDSLQYRYNNYQVTTGIVGGDTVFAATYDGNGNLTSRKNYSGPDSSHLSLGFDVLNHLTSIIRGTDTLFSFTYDMLGRRIMKKDHQLKVTTWYISPRMEVETTPDSVVKTKYLLSQSAIVASVSHSRQSATPAAQLYYHQDFVNSTQVTTTSEGQLSAKLRYRPFGGTDTVVGSNDFRYRFGSKEKDRSGLYYFDSRYYDPVMGRFITADDQPGAELTESDALNRYAYTLNNPIKYCDPSGHFLSDLAINILLTIGDVAMDVASDGTFAIGELELDAAIKAATREARIEMINQQGEKEVGRDFLSALKKNRTPGPEGEAQLRNIYKAQRDVGAKKMVFERYRTSPAKAVPGEDVHGNQIFSNSKIPLLEKEIGERDELLRTSEWKRLEDLKEIGQGLNEGDKAKPGMRYKFTISVEDFKLRAGAYPDDERMFEWEVSHPAIEGNGRDVYTAGYVQRLNVRGQIVLDVQDFSGHYLPNVKSLKMSEPFWQMMKDKGWLNFDAIRFTKSGY